MTRYIDAKIAIEKCDKLIDNADTCPNPYAIEGIQIVRNLILSECETGVPTADVVEVVRCKDCIHREYCNQYVLVLGDERELAFCSYGER